MIYASIINLSFERIERDRIGIVLIYSPLRSDSVILGVI